MKNTWPKFQQALKSIHVEFELLPGELEAKYGGISSLKLAAPYIPECSSWVVIDMGGGSTQITRFSKIENFAVDGKYSKANAVPQNVVCNYR